MRPMIFPSMLAADFSRLADEAARVEGAADWLHIDVMDYQFVPNLTLGLPVVESLLKATPIPLDCHLMIQDPDRWAPSYAEAGAGSVTFHAEASRSPLRTARTIRAAGARVGLGLNPATPIEPFVDLLPAFDMVLVMTIEPGFGGQAFMDETLPKIRRVRQAIGDADLWLQVDGGITEDTIVRAAEAGANVFVAGSSVYGAPDPAAAIERLRARA